MDNSIKLKKISELLGMKFFIPSYQRGYRWTEQQVKDLLNDINEFIPEKNKDSNEETWYCLQPLVVREMDENDSRLENETNKRDWYEVIDGQQRLTTIFIILNCLDNKKLSLQYQTRPNSKVFLEKINEDQKGNNIDFHFMLKAKETINNWNGDKSMVVQKLKDNCKVIWYETNDNAYEVFKRLNSGKISLSNAELVKALLLKDNNFTGMNDDALRLKQLEMAGEWDRMEQTFHDDAFWYFINPEPEAPRFNCTRIDFLLELVLRCTKEKPDSETYYDVDAELQKNNYFIFSKFSELIKEFGWERQWKLIQMYYRTIKSWYDDREKYHYIGYLMNLRGKDKKDILKKLLSESSKPKDEFLESIKGECRDSIIKKEEVYCDGWEYGKNNDEIHNILLLFNLATTQNQTSEMSRYPFDKHFQAAKKKWSLEHIHAQNEKKAQWDATAFAKIKGYLNQIHVDGQNHVDRIEDLKSFLRDKNTSDDIDNDTYKAIMGVFMGSPVVPKEEKDEKIVLTSNFDKDDHLTNMALLQGDKNAAFNNKTYPEKREKLAEYENVERESLFVPICTRNVFFKHYSPSSTNPLIWDEQAGREYVTAIMKVVAAYLEVDAIVLNENNDFKYGLKLKETSK